MKKILRNNCIRGFLQSCGLVCLVAMGLTTAFAQTTVEQRIAALEARIQQLEQELAATNETLAAIVPSQAPSQEAAKPLLVSDSKRAPFIRPAVLVTSSARLEAPSAALAPAAAPPQQDSLGGELEGLNLFKGVKFGGFLDSYYTFDFNKPGDGKIGYRNFDFNHNSLTLSQVDFELAKAVSDSSPLGYMLQLDIGPTSDWVNGGDFTIGNKTGANFLQYYLSGKAGGLTVDFGKFVTQHGAEVIDTRADWNYSRGLLFAWAIPYYHFGLRATYATPKASFAAYLVNGWNNVIDGNGGKTVGLQLALNTAGKVSFIQNYMVGPEQGGNSDDIRHLFDTVLTAKLGDKATFMANYDYGMDRVDGDHVHWQGIAGYLKFQPTPKFALTPRFEFFSDLNGFATGSGVRQQLKEFTITPEYIVRDNLVMRFEWRADWSNEEVFVDADGDPSQNQNTLGLGMILKF